MALQATFPMFIMCGALTLTGYYSMVPRKRQVSEHSLGWEIGLRQIAHVIPPRTHVSPFIAPLMPEYEGCEIPIAKSGAYLSQIIPGGKHDPYANPLPSEEALAKEKARYESYTPSLLHRLKYGDHTDIVPVPTQKEFEAAEAHEQNQFKAVYRAHPMAEYYRIKAYAKLHPELELDQEKFAKINVEKLRHMH